MIIYLSIIGVGVTQLTQKASYSEANVSKHKFRTNCESIERHRSLHDTIVFCVYCGHVAYDRNHGEASNKEAQDVAKDPCPRNPICDA